MNNWHEAEMSLRLADSRIAGIIERAGPCELIPHEVGCGSVKCHHRTAAFQSSCKNYTDKVPEAL